MKVINVEKADLLKTLRENRELHIKEYDEAIAIYLIELVVELQTMTTAAKAADPGDAIKTHVDLSRPSNYVADYDKAIKMLEWEAGSQVQLDHNEFEKYVQDEWAWSGGFKTLNASYMQ